MDYSFLKSGTDVRGIASELGGKAVELTNSVVEDITRAFVFWCANKSSKASGELCIAVGHDSRITADRIKKAVCRALCDSGVRVLDCALSSTPAMFMTTVDLGCDAAIQITASHHPFDRNGLKFFTPEGGLESSDIAEVLKLASNGCRVESCEQGVVIATDYMTQYAERLCKFIRAGVDKGDLPLKGYKIVVDAGNGAGGFYATNVLEKLGADISGSRFLEPDGMFPNHIPNPENSEAMASICRAVLDAKADLGIIFDTDVDRAGCVGRDGKKINRNRLIALASYIALSDNPSGTVVTDSVTSSGLKSYIENELGGVHYRYKRGYKNVIDKAIELCSQGINCPLAIETSGHAALRENYFLDDGAYLVTKIVIELARGKDIDKIIEPMKLPSEEAEVRLAINKDDFKAYGEYVIAELENYVNCKPGYEIAPDNREGTRISWENGWFLLRLSVHDPVMALNLESDCDGGIRKMADFLFPFLERFEHLDITSFRELYSYASRSVQRQQPK